MPVTFNGPSKIIELDGTLRESIRAIYSRWCDWVAQSDNAKYLPAFDVVADPPKVPVYATLLNGWRIRPLGQVSPYVLTMYDGFLYTEEETDPFLLVASGTNPRIVLENPVIAVGFDAGGGALTAADVWSYVTRTLTGGAPSGDGIVHVIGDTIIVSDETGTTISELTDAELTTQSPLYEIASDPDTNIQLPDDSSTATVEPDSTIGDS